MATETNPRDDGFDPEPPPRPKKQTGGPALAVMIALGLLLVGGLIFALFYFLGGSKGHVDSEMLAFFPADSNVIGGADLEALSKNSKLKEMFGNMTKKNKEDGLQELNNKLKPTGLTIDDFSRGMMGGAMDKGKPTLVLRTKKSFDKAKMAEAMDFKKEQKKGEKTYYSTEWGEALFFPTDTLIVMTSEKHFETLSTKESGKVLVSDEMQELVKKMSKGHLWTAMSRSAVPEGAMKDIDQAKKARIAYLVPELIDAAKDMKGAGFWANLDGDTVKFGGGLLCGNKDNAEKAESALKKEMDEQRNKSLEADPIIGEQFKAAPTEVKSFVSDLQKSLAVDRSGALLEISGSFKVSGLETLLKAFMLPHQAQMEINAAEINREPRNGPRLNAIKEPEFKDFKFEPVDDKSEIRPDLKLDEPLKFPDRKEFKAPDIKEFPKAP